MITLRYHIISIAAVFLALAVGVVLGTSSVSQGLLSAVGGEKQELQAQVDQLTAERARFKAQAEAADRFDTTVAPLAVQGQLSGRSVVLKNVPSRTVQGMKFPGAPYGMKMACGENPKRVYGERGGPGTRMGNMAGYRAAWIDAQEYRDSMKKWRDEGDVYVYFNNDWRGYAVENGLWLKSRLAG